MSGSGLTSQPASRFGAAPTRYGGIDANTDEFRSRHIQAVSVNDDRLVLCHAGGHHSAGHPDHGDGRIVVGGTDETPGPMSSTTPSGSPEAASGGPTLAGATPAGFVFGVMSSGGRKLRWKRRLT